MQFNSNAVQDGLVAVAANSYPAEPSAP